MLPFALLSLLLYCLPELVDGSDKVLIVREIRHSCFVLFYYRIIKIHKLFQAQTHVAVLVTITYKLLVVFRHWHDFHVPAAIKQVEELNGQLTEVVRGDCFHLLTGCREGGKGFEEFEILWGVYHLYGIYEL